MKEPRRALALALALSSPAWATGCKSEEERTVELVEEMGALFEAHQGDCDALGAKFDAFTTENAARFAALRRLGRLSGESKKSFEARYGKRLEAAMRKLMDGATACMSNPKVEGALKKIR